MGGKGRSPRAPSSPGRPDRAELPERPVRVPVKVGKRYGPPVPFGKVHRDRRVRRRRRRREGAEEGPAEDARRVGQRRAGRVNRVLKVHPIS